MKEKNHPTKAEEKRLNDLISQFDYLFEVSSFERNIVYKKEDNKAVISDIDLDIPYQRVYIQIYPSFWKHKVFEQRKALLHEFCHIVANPIQLIAQNLLDGRFKTQKDLEDAVEQTTSRIENLLDAQFGQARGKIRPQLHSYTQNPWLLQEFYESFQCWRRQ